MTEPLYHFLAGAAAAAHIVVSLFFMRFHRKTRERIFAILATAFALLAAERAVIIGVEIADERQGFVYLIRLVAFSLILVGVADKSRTYVRTVRH